MTDNVAVLQGYIKEVYGEFEGVALHLLVKPGTDLGSTFKAWDMELQEFVKVNGWITSFNVA